MSKKMLVAAAALSILALGTASASAHDRDDHWDGGKHWKNYSYDYDDYRYFKKPHHNHYGYWKPYPWWLQFYYQPRWY